MLFFILILLFVCGWYFLWKKKYYILIESAGENADGIKQVLKTQLELLLQQVERGLFALYGKQGRAELLLVGLGVKPEALNGFPERLLLVLQVQFGSQLLDFSLVDSSAGFALVEDGDADCCTCRAVEVGLYLRPPVVAGH